MEQLPRISLQEGMQLRKELYSSFSHKEHPGAEILRELAKAGGLAATDEAILDHVSGCPDCMKKWSSLVREETDSAVHKSHEAADDWYSGGLLEAASSEDTNIGPLTLHSSCNQFCLRILPDEALQGTGLITLDILDEKYHPAFEGKRAEVRDAAGTVMLAGGVVGGRTAAFCDSLLDLDCSSWTVGICSKEKGTR